MNKVKQHTQTVDLASPQTSKVGFDVSFDFTQLQTGTMNTSDFDKIFNTKQVGSIGAHTLKADGIIAEQRSLDASQTDVG